MTGESLRATLGQVDELYHTMGKVQRVRHQVDHKALRQFHRDVRWLGVLVEREGEEENCAPLLRRLRRFCFLSAGTPLPFDHSLLWPPQAAELLKEAVELYPTIYPEFGEIVLRLQATLQTLQASPTNPLWTWLTANVPTHQMGAYWLQPLSDRLLLLADGRTLLAVEMQVNEQQLDLRVGTPQASQEERPVSAQIFLGTSRWFPEWCFTAPRSGQIDLVQCNWVWDEAEYPATFLPNQSQRLPVTFHSAASPIPSEEVSHAEVKDGPEELQAPLVLNPPKFDWKRLLAREQLEAQDDAQQAVPARLHLLQGFVGVWLPIGEDETVQGLELDPDGATAPRVVRLSIDELQPGDHLLLRTGGAGELLDSFATDLLGAEGGQARQIHLEWKKSVRQRVFRHATPERAVTRLKELGSVKANPTNLRYWESDDNLRPQRDEDFRALVALVDMEDRLEQIAKAVELLRFAQQSAGHRISQMILDTVAGTDLAPLRLQGSQVFTPSANGNAGSFTAYGLLDVADGEALITPRRLRRPIPLEEQETE